jgi:hypothetical protein
MSDLYYLSFRDVTSASDGVMPGELYRQADVGDATDWSTALVGGGDWVPWDQVADIFRGKRVCFLVHGFNVSAVNAVRSCGQAAQAYEDLGAQAPDSTGALATLALDMAGADLVVPVLWPGDGFILWSYFTAFDHCAATGAKFAEFLRSSAFAAASVSFISHSLGARVVLETVSQTITLSGGTPRAPFDTAILTAAAVDDTALDTQGFRPVSGPAGLRRIVILSSMNDQVLANAFPPGDLVDGVLFAGYDPDLRALGRYGPAFAAASPAAAKSEWYDVKTGQDHGDYLPASGPPPHLGWSAKSAAVGWFCRDVVDGSPFAEAPLNGWAIDNTGRFRTGWTPRL